MGSWKKRLAYHINNKYYNGDELMLQESWTTIIILVTALAYLIYKLKKSSVYTILILFQVKFSIDFSKIILNLLKIQKSLAAEIFYACI